jgi:AcrR family transcriptional regulator
MAAVKGDHGRTYGGQTGSERAADRRDALRSAAFAIVAEQGWRDLTIEAVCRRARLHKRYFYESFADQDALIAAVTEHLAEEAIAVTLAAIDPAADGAAATRSAISAFVAHLVEDPRRARVLFGAVPAGDAAAGHRAAAIREVIATVAAQGRSIHALAEDPTVDLSAAMLVGGTSQAVLDWLDGRIDCNRDQLIDDLIVLWQSIGDTAASRVRGRG